MHWPYRPLLGWIFLAVVLRVAYSLSLPPKLIYPDEYSFDRIAQNLVETGTYGTPQPTAGRTPGYVLFLAAVFPIAGHSIVLAPLAHAVLGALMVRLLCIWALD